MPSPRPSPPSDAAHARHDPLLIAQHTAGDQLDAQPAREAQRLMATCPACAELAADLRRVSSAVAWEPLPPRRRDLRIDPVRAEQLRGSAWSRLLRRFALPQSRALRPVAAGVLSLGLVLVVAGNAWPTTQPSTPVGPAAPPHASAGPELKVGEDAAPAAVPPTERMVEAPATASDATDDETGASRVEAADAGREGDLQELYASETEASPAAPRERDATFLERADAMAQDTAASDTAAAAVGAAEEAPGLAAPSAVAGAPQEEAAIVQPMEAQVGAPVDGDGADRSPAVNQGLASVPGVPDAPERGAAFDVETLLIWVGVGLAIAGAVLLLLTWLSRRASDPLLR